MLLRDNSVDILISIHRMRLVSHSKPYILSLMIPSHPFQQLYDYALHDVAYILHTFLSMQDGTTAISYAAMKGHSDVVQLLIQSNADVDLPDKVIDYVSVI